MTGVQEIKQRFGIIGNNADLNRAIEKAILVAPTDISVLVTGESGVGKENIPKIIHNLSHRKHGPYITVNCGAIPEGTIESELFGHEKGSFTGASGARKGYFEVANGGTIFLDEVGELPLTTQVKLLRVLETGEFMKVGSSKPEKTDVRIVAATNLDMMKAIRNGKFREDLYYRLNTVEIHLPPLRGRKEDIHLLFRKFAADFAEKYHMPPVRLTEDAVRALENYDWPGNIRQMRNFTEQISIVEANKLVDADTLRSYLPNIGTSGNNLPVAYYTPTDGTEKELLLALIKEMRIEINDLRRAVNELSAGHISSLPLPKPVLLEKTYASPSHQTTVENEEEADAVIDIAHTEESGNDSLSLSNNEKELIRNSLKRHGGRRKDAAEELGISERTLYRKIKLYNL